MNLFFYTSWWIVTGNRRHEWFKMKKKKKHISYAINALSKKNIDFDFGGVNTCTSAQTSK